MCKYRLSRGGYCREPNFSFSEYCILHFDIPLNLKGEEWDFINDLKQREFLNKVKRGDYDFEGAKFGNLKHSGHFNSEVNLNNAKFYSDVDFSGVHFLGDAQFLSADFFSITRFRDVFFIGDTYFSGTKFSIVDFSNVYFCKNVFFSRAIFGFVAIFNDSTFLLDAIFTYSKFLNGKASFTNAKFLGKGKVSFSNSEIKMNIDFSHTKFLKDTYFRKTTFLNFGTFLDATFSSLAFFQYTSFLKDVNFNDVTFNEDADFSRAIFSRKTNFIQATFFNDADFSYTFFSKEIEFLNEVSFNKAKFLGNANFTGAIFLGETNFLDARFKDIFSLEKSQFSKSFLLKIIMEENCILNLLNAIFEIDLTIDISELHTSNIINMIATRVERNLIYKPTIIKGLINIDNLNISGEIKGITNLNFKNPSSEENFSRNVKRYYENLGRFKDADDYYLRERKARRKTYKERSKVNYLIEWPLEHLFFYGTKPWYTFGYWIFFIIFFTLIYWILGVMHYPVFRINNNTSWDEYLYFSLTNAMTPGYGVISPEPYGFTKYIPCVQTIISIFFLAIFIAIISRKSMRS